MPRKLRPDMRQLLAIPALLAVVALPAAPATAGTGAAITVTVSPDPAYRQHTVYISGTVSPARSTQVTVTRTDPGSPQTVPVGTAPVDSSTGRYELTDMPAVPGNVTWHVMPADDTATTDSASVTVYGAQTHATLSADATVVPYGKAVHLNVHVSPTDPPRQVTIVALPQGRASERVIRAMSSGGEVSAAYPIRRHTRFVARVAPTDDFAYGPASAHVRVEVRARLEGALYGGRVARDGTHIYPPHAEPRLTVHLFPHLRAACIHFEAQRRSQGRWRLVTRSGCVRTDGQGRAVGLFAGDHQLGAPYRARATWSGNDSYRAGNTGWRHLEFRRS